MRVRFEDLSAFGSHDAGVYRQLERLFLRAAIGQHELELDDPEQVCASDFYAQCASKFHQEEWQELINRVAAVSAFDSQSVYSKPVAVVGGAPKAAETGFQVPVGRVGDWAEQPLVVLLENEHDAVLVRSAAQLSAGLGEAWEQKWLVCQGCGGGGEVQKRVEERESTARVFVLIDSDKNEPDGPVSKKAASIQKKCAEKGVSVHVLSRRELENYVPAALWELVVSTPSKNKPRTDPSKHKAVQVYRWLLGQLDSEQTSLSGKFSEEAFGNVRKDIEAKASKRIAQNLDREQLKGWHKLSQTDKSVDDLKVRFGEVSTKQAIELWRKSLDESAPLEFDDDAVAEFQEIASEIDAWL